MNNKILARVVAVVLSVMMLGTVAFAAPALNKDGETVTGVINDFGETNFGTQKTLIAFKAASADATAPASADDILAIAQGASIEPTISFSASKVPNDGYVIVAYGGDSGIVERTALAVSSLPTGAEGAMIVGELKSIVVGDKTIKNVIEVNATFPAAEATVTEVGYKVTKVGGATHNITKEIATVVEGPGDITFSLLMVGVPADATMQFVPYIKY